MPQVISFTDYTPPVRYDGIAWTKVQIEEGTTSVGPWTLIDTQNLSPVDLDPTSPASRNFTTANASSTADLWYRVIWVDAGSNTSDPTAAVQNASPDGNDLCSVEDIFTSAAIPTGTLPDPSAQIQAYISLASNRIRNEYGHFTPYEVGATKTFLMVRRRVVFFPYFLANATAVQLTPESSGSVLDSTIPDWQLEPFVSLEGVYTSMRITPFIAAVSPRMMRFGSITVQVTGDWGFNVVPDAVKHAAIVTVRSWMLRDSQQYSTSVQYGDPSILPRPAGTYALPNAAREALALFTPLIGIA